MNLMGLLPASLKNGNAFARLNFVIFKKLSKKYLFAWQDKLNNNHVAIEW